MTDPSESAISRNIILGLSRLRRDVTLFRNNTGKAWQGDVTHLRDGSILIKNPRLVNFGLFTGSSDFIGWQSVTVTPEMVGYNHAIFTGLEVKRSAREKCSKPQKIFLSNLEKAGGNAGVVHDLEGALKILR